MQPPSCGPASECLQEHTNFLLQLHLLRGFDVYRSHLSLNSSKTLQMTCQSPYLEVLYAKTRTKEKGGKHQAPIDTLGIMDVVCCILINYWDIHYRNEPKNTKCAHITKS